MYQIKIKPRAISVGSMGFDTGKFTVSKLPPGVKHTEEALQYVCSQSQRARPETAPAVLAASRTNARVPLPGSGSSYNTGCNLYM